MGVVDSFGEFLCLLVGWNIDRGHGNPTDVDVDVGGNNCVFCDLLCRLRIFEQSCTLDCLFGLFVSSGYGAMFLGAEILFVIPLCID